MATPYKVLIVEDEPLIAENLRDLLTASGYDVVNSASGAELAFAIAEDTRPDVAVIDVKLAGALDGVTLALELSRRYRITAVFITGNPQAVCDRAWDLRYFVLAKPFSESEFLDTVAAACTQIVATETD
jgi:DNA-binding response OmpR family regulator